MSHLWSLAQEEQFYVLFPLLLIVALRRGVRATALAWSLITLSAVMFTACALTAGSIFAEFSPFTKGLGLVAGCLIAVGRWSGIGLRIQVPQAWTAVMGLPLVITFSILGRLSKDVDIPAAVLVACVVIAHLTAAPTGIMARWLRSKSLVWVGLVSYSLYLWHLPLLVLARDVWDWTSFARAAIAVPVALLVAELSPRFVEQPIARVKERWVRARPVDPPTVAPTPAAQD